MNFIRNQINLNAYIINMMKINLKLMNLKIFVAFLSI